jgi:predicted NAD-dependent protein-ADP-ribosyltransferase YbiA (DUF1768 family)
MKVFCLIFSLSVMAWSSCEQYPKHWWKNVPANDLQWWEISPGSVNCQQGRVIISKRNELGILSNFAATPFILDGVRYASLEGFWQMMKFPENSNDPRYLLASKSHYTRELVASLTAFEAKKAGDFGSEIMNELGINWVTYKNQKMQYRTEMKLDHFNLIKRAMLAKLKQNSEVENILKNTKDLILLPDHEQKNNTPPAWKYNEIWMEIRNNL